MVVGGGGVCVPISLRRSAGLTRPHLSEQEERESRAGLCRGSIPTAAGSAEP